MLGGLYFRMMLLINICREKLHYLEFVKPVEDILKKVGKSFFVKKYKEVTKEDLARAEKIIICGTSLRDNDFSLPENARFFSWIRDFDKPLLGICGGMQVIAKLFGAKVKKEPEMGFFKERFYKSFLGIEGFNEVYHLHNYYADLYNSDELEPYSISDKEIVQAFKHKTKEIYGVLFHPEVRQKELIFNFCKINS